MKKVAIIFSILIVIGISALLLGQISSAKNCQMKTKEFVISGTSMSGIIESGERVQVEMGFYTCNEIKRGDVVVHQFSPDKDPLIKMVRAIPGDTWGFEVGNKDINLVVNGEILLNSKGQAYKISEGSMGLLKLYYDEHDGKIPLGAYMILGNKASGSFDSTRFGLVSKNDILGKVIKK
ncbi:MAG: signal peptidase I [Candidatus Harrisonbacteria bacterium CG10_big_fil_rev_8_21_14_0_10_45_28]|uniref:Signal peptidase I n=1 Tax=Candidatus Harrisonbacteria bacterium CG10_big_fil_rev_8_21_14_0_10_45_28 TaxID=1974586 RepID=A0A2H0UNZ2_9BACT|nr:MAG: signal peptidase I [Candidatus Harrisonbacteria bacterium CG10_big_fil_rev_8_21_14_0_10_45_28]